MVKIVKGVYGFVDENGAVQPKTSKDEPFSMAKELEARLVEKGVAVYVDTSVKTEAESEPEPEADKEDEVKKTASTKKAKSSQKKKTADTEEEPPVIEAVDPE